MQRNFLVVLCLALAPITAAVHGPHAQEPDLSLTFEVASVKPGNVTPGGPMMMGMRPQGERFTATNMPLMQLVTIAFQVKFHQVIGMPSWGTSAFFDIQAKAPAGVPLVMTPGGGSALATMLRNLLIERFNLKTHKETRELPVYALLKARDDGKLGSGITPSTLDCEAMMRARRPGGPGGPGTPGGPGGPGRQAGGPPPFAPPKPGERPTCGMLGGPGTLKAGGMQIANFLSMLEGQTGRVVIDRTGLTGAFDIDMTYTPDFIANRPAGSPPPQFNGQTIDPNGPTLFTALQEQLGLKLESTKAPVEVLVIDSVSHPTPD